MKTLLILITVFLSSHAMAMDNPLIGKWKSNKEETLKLLRKATKLTPENEQKLRNDIDFGNLVLIFTAQNITTIFQDKSIKEKYEVIENNGNIIKIRVFNKLFKNYINSSFKVKGNRMLVFSETSPTIIEVLYKTK